MTTAAPPTDHAGVTLADLLIELRGIRDLLADRAAAPPADDDDHVGSAGLAVLLGVSESKVKRMKTKGQLPPHVEHGERSHKWRVGDVRLWLAEKKNEVRRGQNRRKK